MALELDSLDDFSLETYRRIAWHGERVRLSAPAWQRIGAARENFLGMIAHNPDRLVYGVTSGFGDTAAELLDEAGRTRQAKRPPYSLGVGVGDPLPARVVRGIVFARLAAFIEGHAAVSPATVRGVVEMLDGRPLPALPLAGQIASGEVDPLNGVFHHLIGAPCEMKDGGSLVNGAPCSAALAAEVALRTAKRLALIHQVFALSVEAARARLEVFDPVLASAWHDPHDQAALLALAGLLEGADDTGRPAYQPPVSWRVIPKVVGQLHRALAALEAAAGHALRTPGDNPLYFGPDADHPDGRAVSNGSFHDGASYPAIDAVSFALADLTVMTNRQATKLHNPAITGSAANSRYSAGPPNTQPLLYLQSWFGTKARDLARPTFLPLDDGGHFKSDILLPTFYAYDKQDQVAVCLEQCLAGLAAVASQVLWEKKRQPAPALRDLLAEIRAVFPPIESLRPIGTEIGALQECFSAKSVHCNRQHSPEAPMTVDVSTEAVIDCPLEAVSDYAADPDKAPLWYVNIKSVDWRTAPPLQLGSRITFVAAFLGRRMTYTYEVIDFLPGRYLTMRTTEGPFPMETHYSWEATAAGGTRMTLRNRGDPAGFSRLVAPFMALAMRRANRKDLALLKRLLERGVG